MDILNINIKKYLPDIIDVYTKIFGEQYREVIEKRVNGSDFYPYNTEMGIAQYIEFLEKCKQRELSLRFLQEIGIDISSHDGKSYAEEVSPKLKQLIVEYIGGYSGFYDIFAKDNIIGIRAFDKDVQQRNRKYQSEIIQNQIRFLNLLLGGDEERIITKEELEEFFGTDEYREIQDRIQGYNEIYNRLFTEFQEYEKSLEPYMEFKRKRKEEKSVQESEDYKKILQKMGDTEENRKLLEAIFEKEGIMTCFGKELKRPTVFFTLSFDEFQEGGVEDYTLLHEYCHVIETHESEDRSFESGFDSLGLGEINPYRENKRKYERLNETITDIFSVQATRILHGKGLYMVEPKELSSDNIMDANTSSLVKKLVFPFVKRYKQEIIRARITGDMEGLFDVIGKDNFEALNDCVNIVDYLALKGLGKELSSEKQNSRLVSRYKEQIERAEHIYANMESNRDLDIEER